MMKSSRSRLAAAIVAASLTLVGCGTSNSESSGQSSSQAAKISIEDNHGNVEVPVNPEKVVVTDNSAFETLEQWGIKPVAAPKAIMPESIGYKKDDSIVDLGNHREPNLESIVAAEPDLIINGQRFRNHYDEIKKLASGTPVIEIDARDGKPLVEELKRETTDLGKIFKKEKEADKLNADLDKSIEDVKAAYKPEDTVMAVNVSGGKIGYIAPSKGRTLGPVFDIFGLKPALEVANGSNDHQGDDISVEAIAAANPKWIIVMDRDAAIDAKNSKDYQPAKTVLENSEALKNVDAIKNGNVIIMPADTYTNEGIQTYTEFFQELAKAFKK